MKQGTKGRSSGIKPKRDYAFANSYTNVVKG